MGKHPLNLTLRFILELLGLYALAYWSWTQHTGWLRFAWAIGLPLAAATLWGTFRVPDDPGKAPVPVPGWVRLALEAAYFGAAVWLLNLAGQPGWALAFGLVVLLHYALSYDRVAWMVGRRVGET